MHTSHPLLPAKVMISSGAVDHPVPRQLSEEELKAVTRRYVDGAKNALAAGFDGAWQISVTCTANATELT